MTQQTNETWSERFAKIVDPMFRQFTDDSWREKVAPYLREIKSFITTEKQLSYEEGRERVIKLLPIIEVMRDVKKGAFALRYKIGTDYVQSMLIDQHITEELAIDIVLKTVAQANDSYKRLARTRDGAQLTDN